MSNATVGTAGMRRWPGALLFATVVVGCVDDSTFLDPSDAADSGAADASAAPDASAARDAGEPDAAHDAGVHACPPLGRPGSWAPPNRLLTRNLFRFTAASHPSGEMVAVGFGGRGLQVRLRRAGVWQPPSPVVSAPGLREVAVQPAGAPAYVARASTRCEDPEPCQELSVFTVAPGERPSAVQVQPGGFEVMYPNAVDAPTGSADELRVAFAARFPADDAAPSLGFYVARRRAGAWMAPTSDASLVPPTSCCLSGDLASNPAGESALVIQSGGVPDPSRLRLTLGPLTDTGFEPRWNWEAESSPTIAHRPRVWVGEDGVGFVFYEARDPASLCPAGPECAAGCMRLYRRRFDLRGGALGEPEAMSSVETSVFGALEVASGGRQSIVVSWWQSQLPASPCGPTPEFGTLQVAEWLEGRWTEPNGLDDVVEPGRQRRLLSSVVGSVRAERAPDGRLALLWNEEDEVQAAIREPDGRWITSEECADPWPNNRVQARHVAWSPPGRFHFFFNDTRGAYEVTSP